MAIDAAATLSATSGEAPLVVSFADASVLPNTITETGTATDTITETGVATDTITEG
jgi:hypothetical protein